MIIKEHLQPRVKYLCSTAVCPVAQNPTADSSMPLLLLCVVTVLGKRTSKRQVRPPPPHFVGNHPESFLNQGVLMPSLKLDPKLLLTTTS